jgi:tetratricopeptide (TPR) repeat protein
MRFPLAVASSLCLMMSQLTAAPVQHEETPPRLLDSGPVDNAYTALNATHTRAWVKVKAPAMTFLDQNEKLKLFVQWAPVLTGPWKTRTKGELEVRSKLNFSKDTEHERLYARGYVRKDPNNPDVATLEMGPLNPTRWSDEGLPYFRIAQAFRVAGEQWNRPRKKQLTPEDNRGEFSEPFQAEIDLVFVYLPDKSQRKSKIYPYNTQEVHADNLGPWSNPSFKYSPLPYVSFFVGLGGTNHSSMLPGHPFFISQPNPPVEMWSCHDKPNGYRGESADVRGLDTLWWGVCPVRVPLPPVGQSKEVVISSQFGNKTYKKTYTIHGRPATPGNVAIRDVLTVRLKNLLERIDPKTPTPKYDVGTLAEEKKKAKEEYRKILEIYQQVGEEQAVQLAKIYITILQLQQKEHLANRAIAQANRDPNLQAREEAVAKLHDTLSAAAIAEQLQQWNEMKRLLDLYRNTLELAIHEGTVERTAESHFLRDPMPLFSLEPIREDFLSASYIQLLKSWAWTQIDPKTYEKALQLKQQLLQKETSTNFSPHVLVSPQEYRELAELIMERQGNRDVAEKHWRTGEQLILDIHSPFHNPTESERSLRMLHPGWWPE